MRFTNKFVNSVKKELGKYSDKEDKVDPLEAILPRTDGLSDEVRSNPFV